MPNDQLLSRDISHTLKGEADSYYSREKVDVLAGQNLAVATVLGKVTAGTVPTTGSAGVNTGNGTCTTVTGGRRVQVGTYTITCVTAVANGGTFKVTDPYGAYVGTATVGVAFTSAEINLTLNDGGIDFVVGDSFTVAVPAGGGQVRAINFSGVDGSGVAYGLLISAVDASASGQYTRAYTSGGTYEIQPGDTIVGAISGATARVVSVGLTSGSWAAGTAAGTFVLDTHSATPFQAENLNVGANTNVATIGGAATAVAAVDVAGVAIVRDAQIVTTYLVWPSGATSANKAQALAELASAGIVTRTAA